MRIFLDTSEPYPPIRTGDNAMNMLVSFRALKSKKRVNTGKKSSSHHASTSVHCLLYTYYVYIVGHGLDYDIQKRNEIRGESKYEFRTVSAQWTLRFDPPTSKRPSCI